ncbi:MAG: sodium/solute symporter [Elusimicrobiota bacterium]
MVFMFAGSLALLCLIGYWAGRRVDSASDFFLAGRTLPAWAVVLSFVAAEISAMTVVGVPAVAYRDNWQFLQFFIGSACARIVVAFLFIPAFYRLDCTTIYDFLQERFGAATRTAAALLFFVTRILASSVRLMAACAIVSGLLGWSIVSVLVVFCAVGIGYIAWGGIRAVVWTGVAQTLVVAAAALAVAGFLAASVEGGIGEVLRLAESAGRLELWKWGPGDAGVARGLLADPNILWVALITGFFGSLAAFGTDHEMMQRVLTVRTRLGSQKAMILTMVVSFVVLVLYLAVGTGLFVFYDQHPEMALPRDADGILPHFALQILPEWRRGLVLAAIVMASIDLPLASLGTVFVNDLYRPWFRPEADERHLLRVTRASAGAFGVLLAVVAFALSVGGGWLWLAFKIGGVTYGPLLGVFVYGLLSRRKAGPAAAWAMGAATLLCWALLVLSENGRLPLGWHWLPFVGTAVTAVLTRLLSPAADAAP